MADAPKVGRRTWLKLGVAGGALFAVGGGVAAWLSWGYDRKLGARDRPVSLSVKEFAVVRAVVSALLPGADDLPPGNELGVAQRVDEELWAASEKQRAQLKQGLQLLEHLPLAYGRASRFTALDPDDAARLFTELVASDRDSVRQLALALKQLVHLEYYGDERTWAAMRYDGPLGIARKPPASHVAYARLVARRGGRA